MKANWFWIFVVVILVAWFGYYQVKESKEQHTKQTQKKNEKIVLANRIKPLIEKHGARRDWGKDVTHGEKIDIGHIFTIELEDAWIKKGPILFIGTIIDIITIDNEQYNIVLEYSYIQNEVFFGSTTLRLSLSAKKSMLNECLKNHPEIYTDYMADVAVAARIENITSEEYVCQEGTLTALRIGHGELLDVAYISDIN